MSILNIVKEKTTQSLIKRGNYLGVVNYQIEGIANLIGQKIGNLQQVSNTANIKSSTKLYRSKNNLRTFQANNWEIFKNSQLQNKFTASYKKEYFVIAKKAVFSWLVINNSLLD